MKRTIFILFVTLLTGITHAQFNFNTGNADLDADLNLINTNAKKDLPGFKTELSISFGVEPATINNLFTLNMEPGEVYFTLEIANLTGKPVENVSNAYKKHKGKGWGVIAQELGIKPGSDEFHALKGKTHGRKDKGNKGNKGKKDKK